MYYKHKRKILRLKTRDEAEHVSEVTETQYETDIFKPKT